MAMDYRETVWAVYDALCELDEEGQFPFVKAFLEPKLDAVVFPMKEFDSVCEKLFGNKYSDLYQAFLATNRVSSFVLKDAWGLWNGEEEYFVSEDSPAEFIKDEFSFFEEAIKHDDWLIAFGFDLAEIEAFKQSYAKYYGEKNKENANR